MRIVFILIAMTPSCSFLRERPSAIMQKAEQCGAGDLAGTSDAAMQDWFHRHRGCAVTIDELCRPVRQAAMARWADSTEGRVCAAARSVTQWSRKPSTNRERFQAGWK